MKRNLWNLTLLVAFAFLTLPIVSAQGFGDRNSPGGEGRFGIAVKVVTPNGRPAFNFKVAADTQDFKNYTGATDKDGAIRFGGLSSGNYTITVTGNDDFETETEPVIIGREQPSGQTFNVIVYLRFKKGRANPPGVVSVMLAGVPKDAVEKYEKAGQEALKKNFKEAIALLNTAIAIYPQFALAYNDKGLIYQEEKEYDNALVAFKMAVSIKPDYFDPKLNYGVVLYLKKDYSAAEAILLKVLELKKDSPTAHYYMGLTLVALQKIEEAEAALKYAVGLKDGQEFALAHRYLGGIYMQKQKYKEAVAELDKYLELAPKAPDADKIKSTIADLKKKA